VQREHQARRRRLGCLTGRRKLNVQPVERRAALGGAGAAGLGDKADQYPLLCWHPGVALPKVQLGHQGACGAASACLTRRSCLGRQRFEPEGRRSEGLAQRVWRQGARSPLLLHRVALPKVSGIIRRGRRRLGLSHRRRYINVLSGAALGGWRSGGWGQGRSISIACCTEVALPKVQ